MHERRFNPSEAHKLDDPERLIWLPPAEVVARLAVRSGMTVADIGAGTGYFALPIARVLAPSGIVYAVDVQPEMLAMLRHTLAAPEAPHNITLVEGDASGTHLRGASIDVVLMANLWHELDDHTAALHESARIVRRGGRIAILDWRPDVERPPGPPIDHRLPATQVVEFLTHTGWSVEQSGTLGRYSFLVVARAPAAPGRRGHAAQR